jgi:CRISPR-associated RAMP protein (TIGR02581 family)
MFHKFENLIKVQATLKCVTPIHIGAVGDSFKPTEINGAIVRYDNGDPFIPGSSLKGILRSFLANVNGDPLESKVEKMFQRKEDRAIYTQKKLAELIEEYSKTAEKLFGSSVMAAKVKIADATLKASDSNYFKSEIRNGVHIDRDTGIAANGALFDTEVIPAGTEFDFRLSAENLEYQEAEDLCNLIAYFREGNITVGGRSRAGLGEISLEHYKIKLYLYEPEKFPTYTVYDNFVDLLESLKKENINDK